MGEGISPKEINTFLDDLKFAQKDGPSYGSLYNSTANLQVLGQAAQKKAFALGGNGAYHINRLLENGRSAEEHTFARALVNNAGQAVTSLDERAVLKVTDREGYDTCLWWTLSPYIFAELEPKIGEADAVKTVLQWSQTGSNDGFRVNLRGLNIYNTAQLNSRTFTLGENPTGFSHQFAKMEAQRLVQEVF